jgi:tRNA-dihydrouridine synthase B
MSKKDFWKKIKKPIIALAPMEGHTDSAFRRICKKINPEIITFTEFTSADGLHYKSKRTELKFKFFKEEKPIIAQIFGKRIEGFITAAKFCEDYGFDGIDINMGCPVKKIFKAEHGVALRKNPALAYKLIEALSKNTSLPVSVKTRLGLEGHDDLIEFSKGAENAGAKLITVHGRTYKEMYRGEGNWQPIYELKKHLNIPVIGNASLKSLEECYEKVENLDGVMVGRAAMGNPWVFAPENKKPKKFTDKLPIIRLHAKYLIEAKGLDIGTREIRTHLLSYVKGIRGAKAFRMRLVNVTSLKEINAILDEIEEYVLSENLNEINQNESISTPKNLITKKL